MPGAGLEPAWTLALPDPRDFKSTNDFRWEAENHATALYYRAYRSMYSALVFLGIRRML